MTRPLILLTNDDGIAAAGLRAAADALAPLGDVLVVAPHAQQTGMGRAHPRGERTGHAARAEDFPGATAWVVESSPAQCVIHGVLEFADRRPDLCVSGINHGENIGLGLEISGTLGAALEATRFSIPSIAVSRHLPNGQHHSDDPEVDWTAAIHFTRLLAAQVLVEGLPDGVVTLNLNVPDSADVNTELRLTRQSRANCWVVDDFERRDDYATRQWFRMHPEIDEVALEPDDDIYTLLVDGVASVTPLSGTMTATTPWKPA